MENGSNYPVIDRMAEAAWLRFTSRWAMVVVGALLPAMVGFMAYFGDHVLHEIDEAVRRINQMATTVEVMQQKFEDARAVRDVQFLSFKGQLDDHEARLRQLERRK